MSSNAAVDIFGESVSVENYELPVSWGGGATSAPVPAPAFSSDESKVIAVRGLIGRKFDVGDVTDEMRGIANRYLANYTGKNSFVWDVKNRGRRISDSQAKGLLNVFYSEIAPRDSKPGPTVFADSRDDDDRSFDAWLDHAASSVGKGTYTVVFPLTGKRVTVRLGTWRPSKYTKGQRIRWISFKQGHGYTLYARQNEGRQHTVVPAMRGGNGEVNSALGILFSDPEAVAAAALAYALESGRCARCDRELTVPKSIMNPYGLGPDCTKIMGYTDEDVRRMRDIQRGKGLLPV